MNRGKLFIISAPSGAGKGTVIARVLKKCPELRLSVSATTRAPRPGEVDGKSYYFVSHERFREMIEKGELLEYAQYVGEYYGTPKKPIDDYLANGKRVILEIEVQGAEQVVKLKPDSVSVFIIPPDMEELERRLRGRGTDSEEKLAARLETAKNELMDKDKYNHIIVNDTIDRAADELLSIIKSY